MTQTNITERRNYDLEYIKGLQYLLQSKFDKR